MDELLPVMFALSHLSNAQCQVPIRRLYTRENMSLLFCRHTRHGLISSRPTSPAQTPPSFVSSSQNSCLVKMKASPRIQGRDSSLEARDDVIVPTVCYAICSKSLHPHVAFEF
jgi:hypothetical protein